MQISSIKLEKVRVVFINNNSFEGFYKLIKTMLYRLNFRSQKFSNKNRTTSFINKNCDLLHRDFNNFLTNGLFITPNQIQSNFDCLHSKYSERKINSVLSLADQIKRNHIQLYGSLQLVFLSINKWFYDPITGYEWNKSSINENIDVPNGSDIKTIWELSRFQFLSPLSSAYLLTKDKDYAFHAVNQINSWIDDNNFLQGPNWSIAMEVSIRLINFCFFIPIFSLAGVINSKNYDKIIKSLIEHFFFIRDNLEYSYLGENNHFLSNIVSLLFSGIIFPSFEWSKNFTNFAYNEFCLQIRKQFKPEGINFEGSIPYHRLSTELVSIGLHALKKLDFPIPKDIQTLINNIKNFNELYSSCTDEVPLIGDNDSGIIVEYFPGQASNNHSYLALILNNLIKSHVSINGFNHFLCEAHFYEISKRNLKVSNTKPDFQTLITNDFDGLVISDFNHYGFFFNTLNSNKAHIHNDRLSFFPYFNKLLLFIDRGSYSYTGYLKKRHEDRRSSTHNGPVVNGWEQNRIWENYPFFISPNAKCHREIDQKPYEICVTGYHEGYSRFRKGMRINRKITWNYIQRSVIITDWIDWEKSDETFNLSWNFLINPAWNVKQTLDKFNFTHGNHRIIFQDFNNVGLNLYYSAFCPNYQTEKECLSLKGSIKVCHNTKITFKIYY